MVSRVFLGALLLWQIAAYPATVVTSTSATATQAVLRIRTDQTGACLIQVSEVEEFGPAYQPVHDVNGALFAGADNCSRADSVDGGAQKTLVIGKRTAEVSGRERYSRALRADTRHYYRIVVGADTVQGSFVTANVAVGNTRNDPRFDRSRPGEYAYPTLNWFNKSVKYVDPTTGLAVQRASGPGELIPRTTVGRTFTNIVGGAEWTAGSYSGTSQSWLYLRADPSLPPFNRFLSLDAVQLVVTLSGTAPGVEVCLTNNGVSCTGAILSQPISTTPATITFGTAVPILESWRNSTKMPTRMIDVMPSTGTLTKAGAVLSWTSGGLFPEWLAAGSLITLDVTDCPVAAFTSEVSLTLADAGCVADGSYGFTVRTWGFLLRAATSDSATVTVSSPTWTSHTTGSTDLGSFGAPRVCSPVKVNGPTGPGQVCSTGTSTEAYSTGNPIYWFGDDGTVNLIGLSFASAAGTGLQGAFCSAPEGLVWDREVAAKYYCLGLNGAGERVIYSIRYTGNYGARVPTLEDIMPNAVVTMESTGLSAMLTAFTANDPVRFQDFSCGSWTLTARQGDDLILGCYEVGQEYPGWLVAYRIATKQIIGAISSYGGTAGMPNRWGAIHTLNIGGDMTWVYTSINPFPAGQYRDSVVTSGTLSPAPWQNCPVNSVDSAITGTPNCSTITVNSLTPTGARGPLYGQTWLPGDMALVLANGVEDREYVRILTITGNSLTVQRNYRPFILGVPKLSHGGTLGLRAQPSVWKEMWWNYQDDPHGQGLVMDYGPATREDPDSSNCHQVFENGVFLLGCVKTEYLEGTSIRLGELPDGFSNPYFVVNWDASFAGSKYRVNITSNEAHPSKSQYTASSYEQLRWFDARPYLGEAAVATAPNVSAVGAYVWKVAAAATAALEYRLQGLIALTGIRPLVDASPAVLSDTPADHYKFCYVVKAGDCRAGSIVGEIYFNVPFLTYPYTVPARFAPFPWSTVRDISFTQNTHTTQTLLQASAHRRDSYGTTVRRLTTGFAPYKVQSTFWNLRALPTGNRFFWGTKHLDEARDEILVADLPPFPGEQSLYRGNFVPVRLSLGGASGDEVRVRFGYSENGPAESLFCHERQVACSTSASGTQPYAWVDESPSWSNCSSGCSISVPAISGRVLYYVIDRRNGGVTSSSMLDAVAVP